MEGATRKRRFCSSGASSSDDISYLPLKEARDAVGRNVNIVAVVTEIGVPRRSKGTDYVLTLKITDQTNPYPGLSMNFFAEDVQKLPSVKASGDIICLHSVIIKDHNGDLYFVYNKKFSSFALFEGENSTDLTPYLTSLKYQYSPQDEMFIQNLRPWVLDDQLDKVLRGDDDITRPLYKIEAGQPFDLICKVLHVCETSEGYWTLFVWDGTDTPPVLLRTDLDVKGENPSPLCVERSHLPRNILCSFPPVGTILRIRSAVLCEDKLKLHGAQLWVRICNLCCELQSGMWKGVMQASSKIRLLADQNESVAARERFYYERKKYYPLRKPMSTFLCPLLITVTDSVGKFDTTLIESLSHPQVCPEFKTVVRVVAACPWNAKDIWSEEKKQYRLRLTLEDPTARVHAYVFGEDGLKFFGHDRSPEEVLKIMNVLLGIKEGDGSTRDPPWVRICLQAYYLDENDPLGSIRYCVFGTKVVVDPFGSEHDSVLDSNWCSIEGLKFL